MIKSALAIFVLTLCLFLSQEAFADIDANKNFHGKEINYNADTRIEIELHSYLYNDCKNKLSDPRFEQSYCADFIRGISFAVYILTAMISPHAECSKEKLETVENVGRFWKTTQVRQIQDIALDYITYVTDGNKPLTAFDNILISEDEKMLASSVVYNYKKHEGSVSSKEELNFSRDGFFTKNTQKLYESCLTVDKTPSAFSVPFERSYCNAMISGIWVGYALIQHQMPSYTKETCADGRNDIVKSFKKRFQRQMACYAPFRKDNKNIAQSYLHMMSEFPVERVLMYANEPAGAVMSATIQMSCSGR